MWTDNWMHEQVMGGIDRMGHWVFGLHNFLFLTFLMIIFIVAFIYIYDGLQNLNVDAKN